MHSHPRWIADDDVEAARTGDVRELRAEGERKRRASPQGSDLVGRFPEATTNSYQPELSLMVRRMAQAEQISGADHRQHPFPIGGETNLPAREYIYCGRSLDPIERSCQGELAWT